MINKDQTNATIRFSRHANARLERRNISFTAGMMAQLDKALDSLAGKNGRSALVLFEQLALLVSVSKRTVITVIGRDQLQNNVFTDIDSVIFV